MHVLKRTQILTTSLDHCWEFFSDPRNLPKITPPELGFEVKDSQIQPMYPGQIFTHVVRPLLGWPMEWVTEITHVMPQQFFVDEQRLGPYAFWHHQHHFRDLGDGRVETTDLVHYKLPLEPFSYPLLALLVRPQLQRIFDFRAAELQKIFTAK